MSLPKRLPETEVLEKIKKVRKPDSRMERKRKTCPHCGHRSRNTKRGGGKKCPHCRRNLDPTARVNVPLATYRRKLPNLLEENRFAPGVMKQLVDMKVYRYLGLPTKLAAMTEGRTRQREANLKLADMFLKSELGQADLGEALNFNNRAAIYFRLNKGFKTLAEHGRFQLTERGRQKIAEQRLRAEIGQ